MPLRLMINGLENGDDDSVDDWTLLNNQRRQAMTIRLDPAHGNDRSEAQAVAFDRNGQVEVIDREATLAEAEALVADKPKPNANWVPRWARLRQLTVMARETPDKFGAAELAVVYRLVAEIKALLGI